MRGSCILLLTALAYSAPPDCPPGESGQSRYCAVLTIKGGRTVRSESILSASKPPLPADTLNVLDAFFDKALLSLEAPYRVALNDNDKDRDSAGTLPDPDGVRAKLRAFDGSIAEYFVVLDEWCRARTDCDASNILSVSQVYRPFSRYQDAPLLFDTESDVFDPESGLVVFRVPPAFDAAKVSIRIPALSAEREARRSQALKKWLRPLNGTLWRRDVVVERIKGYYDGLGLDPDVSVTFAGANPSISLLEGSSLRSVAFPFGLPVRGKDIDWSKTERALYGVLSDQDFRQGYLRNRASIRKRLSGFQAPALDYKIDLGIEPKQAPLLTRTRLPVQQLVLRQNGFNLGVSSPIRQIAGCKDTPGGGQEGCREFSFVDLRLEDLQDEPKKAGSAPEAPGLTDVKGTVQRHDPASQAPTSFLERTPTRQFEPRYCHEDAAVVKKKKNFIGWGGQYSPGQGVRTFGLGQREIDTTFLSGSGSIRGGQAGTGQPVLSGGFQADYIGFEQLSRRLAVDVQGGTDALANRFLLGRKTNERRTGGMGRVELDWFRDRGGHLLRFFASGRREKVTLGKDGVDFSQTYLTAIDLGGVHLFQSTENPYPWTLRLEPILRVAPAVTNSDGFTRGGVSGRVHKNLQRRFAVDVAARYEQASEATPVFELPSLGGAESVRGFRTDDALGNRLWNVQSELWTPVPSRGVAFLRDSVRFATFYDAGNVYGGSAVSGLRSGVGVGARLIYGPVVLKADWGYGFGNAATGGSRGKFYFSVITNLPM